GEPHFNVIGLGRGEAHVAGGKRDHAVVQAELLQNFLGVVSQLLQLLVRSVGPGKFDQFDLLELVLPDDAAHVISVGTSLAAEARSVGGERKRQARCVKHFVAVKVGDRYFGGRNQPQVLFAVGNAKKVGSEFRQLASAIHGLGIHQVRRQHLGVPVFASVQVEHENGQRALQPRSQVPVNREARAGKFGGAFEIEHAQFFAQFPVRLGGEI